MKTNKILTFVITLVFACVSVLACFPSLVAGAKAIELTDADYENGGKVLKTICPDFPLSEGETTTRAEFVAAVTSLMNIPMAEITDTGFSDVAPTDMYAANIKYAADLGLISNVDLFYPDSPVTYAQAIKIVMTAAGYGKKAEYMNGFPTGYLMVAKEADVGLYLGLTNDAPISHKDATALIYDAVTTDMMEPSSFGDTFEYEVIEGKNMLSVYRHIFMAEGVVEANENTGLLSMSAAEGENGIRMNGKTFYGKDYQNLIGKKSRILYDDDNKNTIVCAYPLNNEITEYTEKDNLTISGTVLTAEPHDKDKNERFNLAVNYSLIYNGKYYGAADYNSVINPTAGTVSLIDNDDDNIIEVIIIKDYTYGVIGSVNEFDEKIYDKYAAQGMVDLGDSSVKYLITDADGTPLKLGELEADDIIGYAKSKDSKFYEIVRFDSKVGGTYDELKEGKIVVKGEEYTLSSYYTANVKNLSDLKIGTEVILYLGASNQVVYVEEFATDIKYGVLVAAGQDSGIDGKYRVKLYSQDGEMLELSFAKKVKFNGTASPIANVFPTVTGILSGDITLRVVKFSLNSDGDINKLYTAILNTNGTSVLFKENIAESRPVLYSDNNENDVGNTSKYLFYKSGMFYPLFAASESCLICRAPKNIADINNEKFYSALSVAQLTQEDRESIEAYGYDVDKNGAAFVLLPEDSASSASVTGEPVSSIVESVNIGLNPEGEQAAVVKIYRGGEWKVYYSNEDTQAAVLALKPGDIIGFVSNAFDEITAIETHFSYAAGKKFYMPRATYEVDGVTIDREGDVAPVPEIGYNGKVVGYVGGYIYNFSGGKANIVRADRTDTYKDITSVANAASFGPSEVYPVSLSVSRTVFVKFINDRSTGKTISAEVYKEADMSTLETFFNSGTNADYLVSRERYHSVTLNIVYVNEYVN